MPNRTDFTENSSTPREKSPNVTRIKVRKSHEEEFELLLRTAARLKTSTAAAQKKESAA